MNDAPPDIGDIPRIVEANVTHLTTLLTQNALEIKTHEDAVTTLSAVRQNLEKRRTLLQQALNVVRPLT